MTLRSLLWCLFGHDRVTTRTAHGDMIYRCTNCGHERPVLQTEIITGPKSRPDRVRGEPLTKVLPQKVEQFRKKKA